MLKLQNSYSHPDTEQDFIRGCATDQYVAFSTVGGAIHVLSSDTKLLYTRHDDPRSAWALEITRIGSNQADEVLITGHDNLIKMYTVATGDPRPDFPSVHKECVSTLRTFQMAGNGGNTEGWTMLASGHDEGTIVLWELKSDGQKPLHTLKGHSKVITGLLLHPRNPNLLVSSSYDGPIRVWDVASGAQTVVCELEDRDERMRSFTDPNGRVHTYKETVSSMIMNADGRIISGGVSGIVRVWNSSTGKLEKSWQGHFDGHRIVGPVLNKILLHPSGKAVVTTGTDGRIRLWDLNTYDLLREVKPFEHSTLPSTIAWHGSTLLCAGKDGRPENTCGDFVRVISWDLTRLHQDEGVPEICNELGPSCNFVDALWAFGSRVIISAMRRGQLVIEAWGEQHE